MYFYNFCCLFTILRYAGQVGYIIAGMKKTNEAQIGDTIHHQSSPVEALPGFKPAKPMVCEQNMTDSYNKTITDVISFSISAIFKCENNEKVKVNV